MAYQSEVFRGTDVRLRTAYCSNTAAAAISVGRVVAYRMGATAHDTGNGAGFGYAVDYPLATSSVCIGVVYSQDPAITSYGDGSPCFVMARGVTTHDMWQTGTVNQFLVPDTNDDVGFGDSVATVEVGPSHYGVVLETTGGTETVSNVPVWVNAHV